MKVEVVQKMTFKSKYDHHEYVTIVRFDDYNKRGGEFFQTIFTNILLRMKL